MTRVKMVEVVSDDLVCEDVVSVTKNLVIRVDGLVMNRKTKEKCCEMKFHSFCYLERV